jgi:hypothetical protein
LPPAGNTDTVAGLETLRSLQARFLTAVRDGRWSDAKELQDRRFELMELLLGDRNAPALAAELQAILAKDRELLPQVEQARAEVGGKLRELAGTRKAMNAYTDPT